MYWGGVDGNAVDSKPDSNHWAQLHLGAGRNGPSYGGDAGSRLGRHEEGGGIFPSASMS